MYLFSETTDVKGNRGELYYFPAEDDFTLFADVDLDPGVRGELLRSACRYGRWTCGPTEIQNDDGVDHAYTRLTRSGGGWRLSRFCCKLLTRAHLRWKRG